MKILSSTLAILLAGLFGLQPVHAQWNPAPNWKDSYAVNGICYCDSNGYDHGLDQKSAPTPIGEMNVVNICNDIRSVLGEGPSAGRIPYNDIQCGNGPANDAPDEAGCPGRVDQGPSGCGVIGPKWDLASVYGVWPDGSTSGPTDSTGSETTTDVLPTVDPDTYLSRDGWNLVTSDNQAEAYKAFDDNAGTRWTTQSAQSSGQFLRLDLGALYQVSALVLETQDNPDDYARGYVVSVSTDGQQWNDVLAGNNTGAVQSLQFDAVTVRYIRISQTGTTDYNWWSVHELNVAAPDNGALEPVGLGAAVGEEASVDASAPSTVETFLDKTEWQLYATHNQAEVYNMIDGNMDTRWTTQQMQTDGQVLDIDLQSPRTVSRVILDSERSPGDYIRRYEVSVSNDYSTWTMVTSNTSTDGVTVIELGVRTTRYIRVRQTGSAQYNWWSVHELDIVSPGSDTANASGTGSDTMDASGSGSDNGEIVEPTVSGECLVYSQN